MYVYSNRAWEPLSRAALSWRLKTEADAAQPMAIDHPAPAPTMQPLASAAAAGASAIPTVTPSPTSAPVAPASTSAAATPAGAPSPAPVAPAPTAAAATPAGAPTPAPVAPASISAAAAANAAGASSAGPAASTPCCACPNAQTAAEGHFEAPCGCTYCRVCLADLLCDNMGGQLPDCACGKQLELTVDMARSLPRGTYRLWQGLYRQANWAATHPQCPKCSRIATLPLFTKTFQCSNYACINPRYGYCVTCKQGVQQLPHRCG